MGSKIWTGNVTDAEAEAPPLTANTEDLETTELDEDVALDEGAVEIEVMAVT